MAQVLKWFLAEANQLSNLVRTDPECPARALLPRVTEFKLDNNPADSSAGREANLGLVWKSQAGNIGEYGHLILAAYFAPRSDNLARGNLAADLRKGIHDLPLLAM